MFIFVISTPLFSITSQHQNTNASLMTSSLQSPTASHSFYPEDALEMMSTEMSFSALYLHDQHRWRYHNQDATRSMSRNPAPPLIQMSMAPQLVLHDIQEDESPLNV